MPTRGTGIDPPRLCVDARQDVGLLAAVAYIHPGWLSERQVELGVWFQHSCPAWDWLPGKGIVRAAGGDTGVVQVNGLDWFVAGPRGAVLDITEALKGDDPAVTGQ